MSQVPFLSRGVDVLEGIDCGKGTDDWNGLKPGTMIVRNADDAYQVPALYLLCVGRDTRIEGVKPIKVMIRRRAGCFKG